MKKSTNHFNSTLQSVFAKLFFCSQVFVLSLALPFLFYVGITYNNEASLKKHLMLTNKGKKYLAGDVKEKTEKTITYSAALVKG